MSIEFLELLTAIVTVAIMAAGLGFAWMAVHGRQRLRELAYQERIAMIDKGLVPSPATDPAGFEAMMAPRGPSAKAVRYRTAGILITGFGASLTTLLFFIVPALRGIAIGLGGSFAVIGLTILGNGLLLANDDESSAPPSGGRR